MPIKQSFCYPMYATDTYTAEDVFKRAADTGYDAVEFWARDQYGDHRELFDSARNAGLVIASMIGHGSLDDGMNKVNNHERL